MAECPERYTSASDHDNLDEAFEYESVVESFESSEHWDCVGIEYPLSEIASKVSRLDGTGAQ